MTIESHGPSPHGIEESQNQPFEGGFQAALQALFDYAGLFPPASLSMDDAVRNFLRYQNETRSWMLNAIVIPAARLEEFAVAVLKTRAHSSPVRVSVISSDWNADRTRIDHFRKCHGEIGEVVSIETRERASAASIVDDFRTVYVEVSYLDDVSNEFEALKGIGVHAKLRTGGLTADAFPNSRQVAAFLQACSRFDVSFKATAGLHHPLAAIRPACENLDAPKVWMHGFVNLLGAIGLAERGASLDEISELLSLPSDAARIRLGHPETWLSNETVRRRFHSIGSCSFEEPLDDLLELGWL